MAVKELSKPMYFVGTWYGLHTIFIGFYMVFADKGWRLRQ
jgi:hypothetical protein